MWKEKGYAGLALARWEWKTRRVLVSALQKWWSTEPRLKRSEGGQGRQAGREEGGSER